MKVLKRLQEQYKAGKITKEEYEEQLQELLDDEIITAEQHTEAKAIEVEDGDDLIYSQADVDKIVKKKAESLVKKAYREAGIEVPKGGNLIESLTEKLKAGEASDKNDSELAKENGELKIQLKKLEGSDGKLASLQREISVMKVASKYNPHNVARVVAALDDYEDLLDYDDDGNLDPKSVDRVIKTKLVKNEAYLFKATDADGGDGGEGGEGAGEGGDGDVKGKGPGGGSGAAGSGSVDKDLAAARELMGWNKSEDKK